MDSILDPLVQEKVERTRSQANKSLAAKELVYYLYVWNASETLTGIFTNQHGIKPRIFLWSHATIDNHLVSILFLLHPGQIKLTLFLNFLLQLMPPSLFTITQLQLLPLDKFTSAENKPLTIVPCSCQLSRIGASYLATIPLPKEQFRNTRKGASSIADYCHNLKNLVDALADVDSTIKETELVIQILRGPPSSYQSIIDVVTNTNPFPTFLQSKNMLLVHEGREDNPDDVVDPIPSPTLYSSVNNSRKSKTKWNRNRNNHRATSRGR
ncbi:unnamed protein product [Lactuca saligna]|uniref:Uncharacterized protein n=1 Tax=Lactuca saligna TaxID=75948 RepID=A0AA35XYJ0_LACSI|nr:unnamed protein product [Lactuca saligna]